jgi:hypothetical protein
MVPPAVGARTHFVGGAYGADEASATEAAYANALEQIGTEADRRFFALYREATARLTAEVSSQDQVAFRQEVGADYGVRVGRKAVRDSVYFERPDRPTEVAHSPAGRAFVLVSVAASDWDNELADALAAAREGRLLTQKPELAELAEWMLRHRGDVTGVEH